MLSNVSTSVSKTVLFHVTYHLVHRTTLIDGVVVLHPSLQNRSFWRRSPRQGIEKLNLTQQKQTFTNQKKCTTTQNKQEKTKARFSRRLWQPAWKWTGPILVTALHKSVTYLLTYTNPLTYSPRTHTGSLKYVNIPLILLFYNKQDFTARIWHR